ncbi:right-handed parallel beta-helix repeat-containing protein, partial [Candidatus Poribacteria bacterium]|nr:right-handed parallel beta-helix repeat-containing protein [Candidatus Poribacteria bacterium]
MKSQLLFTTAMLFIMITAASHAATLYVDATNKGAADGSQAKPFNTIQKGIDAAKSGDTVQVAAGTYEGPIQFKDGITLQGAGAAVTKITITVVNDNAIIYVTNAKSGVIDGFTIIGGGPISSGLNLSRSDITITNNVVTNINEYGLYAWSSKPTISNNQFVGNRNTGIWLKRSNAIVTDNVINENGGGIVCEDRANTTITNNEISLNQNEGIAFSSFSAPTIRNNRIIDNDGRGINAYSASATIEDNNIISGNGYIGIEGDSSDMTIRKNKIVENARSGIRLSASNPTISENEIRGNGEFGIWLLSNSGGSVRDNTITENAGGGIGCEGSSPTIEHNTVTDNADAGIACGGAANPTLANNTLSFNGREGIRFDWGSQAGATITGNQIIGNGGEGGIGIWSLNHEAIIITGNKISENSGDGVHIGFAEIVSTGVQIRDNQITDNSGKGIANHTGRAQIRGNLITRNLGNGVWMGDGALPDLGTTADAGSNAIYGNRNSSQLWNSTPNEIQAVGNYWGKGTENEGPKNLIGNDAGGNVLFEPWLKVEPPPPVISGNVLSFTWPARNESGTGRFQIAWQDGDVAKGTLSLYYDTDRVGHDGTPIPGAANIPLSDPKNQYVWEPSGLPIGATYYLYAEINDGAGNLSYVYSTGSITLGGGGTTRGTFNLTLEKGLNMVSLPVRPDTSYTAQTLIDKLSATVLIKFNAQRQSFVPYLPGISNDFPIEGGAGYIVNVTEGKTVPFTGTVW